jgi:hypothetical protein
MAAARVAEEYRLFLFAVPVGATFCADAHIAIAIASVNTILFMSICPS